MVIKWSSHSRSITVSRSSRSTRFFVLGCAAMVSRLAKKSGVSDSMESTKGRWNCLAINRPTSSRVCAFSPALMVELAALMVELDPLMVELPSLMVELKPLMVELKPLIVELPSLMVELGSKKAGLSGPKTSSGFVAWSGPRSVSAARQSNNRQ
jgi:hypothetical protein